MLKKEKKSRRELSLSEVLKVLNISAVHGGLIGFVKCHKL
jgi:hypothetical protein